MFFQAQAGTCIKQDLIEVLENRVVTSVQFKSNAACQGVVVWSVDDLGVQGIQAAYFDGTTWVLPGQNDFISTFDDAAFPSVSLNDAGQAVAIWKANMKARISCFSFDDVLSGWSAPIDIGDARQEADENGFFAVSSDDQGLAIAVWPDFENGKSFVRSSRSTDCINWSTQEKISADSSQTLKPRLAMSKNGRAVSVWRFVGIFSGGAGSIQAAPFNNGQWKVQQSSEALIENPFIDYKDPFVSMNKTGDALITWIKDNGNAQVVQGILLDPQELKASIVDLSPNVTANRIDVQRSHINSSKNALVTWSLANDLDDTVQYVQYAFYNSIWHVPQDNNTFIIGRGFGPHVCLDDTGDGAILYVATFPDEPNEPLAISLFDRLTNAWTTPQILAGINPDEPESGDLYSLSCARPEGKNGASGFVSRNILTEELESIQSVVCCKTESPTAPSRPTGLVGKQGSNRFAMQAENFVELHWNCSPDSDILSQNIYRDGTFVANIPGTVKVFFDHNLTRKLPAKYSVTAVNQVGLESMPTEVTL